MAELWQTIWRGSWGERLKLLSLFLLIVGGWVSIYVLTWWLDGK
jgi:hypothetical protein